MFKTASTAVNRFKTVSKAANRFKKASTAANVLRAVCLHRKYLKDKQPELPWDGPVEGGGHSGLHVLPLAEGDGEPGTSPL